MSPGVYINLLNVITIKIAYVMLELKYFSNFVVKGQLDNEMSGLTLAQTTVTQVLFH